MLKGIKEGEADRNEDYTITLSELQAYLLDTVPEMTNGRQQPTSRIENITNDWGFDVVY